MKKKITIFIIGLIAVLVFSYKELVMYGMNQLRGQLSLLTNSIAIEEALESTYYSNKEKDKLRLIQEIRYWASSELQLNVGGNYAEVVKQDSSSTMYVVTAAYPYKLESFEWSYGPIGKMAYKGFFDKRLVQQEAKVKRDLGYDTDIGIAGGWSTLGVLNDPVLSGMLKRDSTSLIELIIHESVHATVFRFGETEWNENIATAIGEVGMEQFVKQALKDDGLYRRHLDAEEKTQIKRAFIHNKALELESLYKSWERDSLNIEEREILKQEWMNGFKSEYLKHTNIKSWPSHKTLNNTFFTDFLNYRASNDSIKEVLAKEFANNIPAFLNSVK